MNQLIDSLTSGDSEEADMPQQDLSAVAAEQKKQMKSKQTSAEKIQTMNVTVS